MTASAKPSLLLNSTKEFLAGSFVSCHLSKFPSSLLQTFPDITFYPTLHPLSYKELTRRSCYLLMQRNLSPPQLPLVWGKGQGPAHLLTLDMVERCFFLNKRAILTLRGILSSFKVIEVKTQPVLNKTSFFPCKICMSDHCHHTPTIMMVNSFQALTIWISHCAKWFVYIIPLVLTELLCVRHCYEPSLTD